MIRTTSITTAVAPDLVDIDSVKAELGVVDDTTDTVLARIIRRASELVSTHLGANPLVETVVDRFDAAPVGYFARSAVGTPLNLSRFPVTAVASVTEDGTSITSGTDYRLQTTSGLVFRCIAGASLTAWATTPIVVTYSAGYATLPGAIEEAVLRLVRLAYLSRDTDPRVRSERVEEIGERTFFNNATGIAITPDIEALLSPYRTPRIA